MYVFQKMKTFLINKSKFGKNSAILSKTFKREGLHCICKRAVLIDLYYKKMKTIILQCFYKNIILIKSYIFILIIFTM